MKDLLGMVQDLRAEVQSLKIRLSKSPASTSAPAGSARNVINNLKTSELQGGGGSDGGGGGDDDDDDDDDEGLGWLPRHDEDLKLAAMESEEVSSLSVPTFSFLFFFLSSSPSPSPPPFTLS